MNTGRMVFSSSLAKASSRTTFLDLVELEEMARMSTLQWLMAPTISSLHMAAPSMPIFAATSGAISGSRVSTATQ